MHVIRQDWRWALLLVALSAAAVAIGWIGFMASDDSLYYAGALRWLTDPPFAGSDHWSTRFPLTLTFAAMIALVGRNYAAFALTALLFYIVLIVTTGACAARVGGRRVGWIAALLTATMPVVIGNASTVGCDLIEGSALLIGAMLLAGAADDRAGLWRGLAAGAAFGVAILCRETSVLPLVALAPMFALGRPVPRRVLLASGIGLAIVLGGEALFQYAMTGAPLRRYDIAFHHDSHIDRAANLEGNFLLWPPIDPLLVLLINDDFGLLFWIAGAAVAAGTLRGLKPEGQRQLVIVGAMAAASFVLVAVLTTKLVLNPRYFLLPALAGAIVAALWLDRLGPRVRVVALTAIVGSNLLLLSVGNAHPRWEMEALIDAAARHPGETIAGTPEEVRRAEIPAAFARIANLRGGAPRPGELYVVPADTPASGAIVATYPSPPTRLGALLRALRLEAIVPAPIARRMFAPSPAIVLRRVPAAAHG